MTTVPNTLVSNLIRDLDVDLTYNNRRVSADELFALYNLGIRIHNFYNVTRDTANLALFAINMNSWRNTGWNPAYIIPVATSGIIWIRNTSIYNKVVNWIAGVWSGWNAKKTIRNGIKFARIKTIYDLGTVACVLYGLNWRFSPMTFMLCMPAMIFNGIYYSLTIYGLNYMLSAELSNRLVNFLSETLGSMANELLPTGSNSQRFEELVDTETFSDTNPQSCPICIQDDRLEMARIKSCRHSFCQKCLREWYHKPARIFNCPLCRIDLDTPIDRVPIIRDTLTQLLQ